MRVHGLSLPLPNGEKVRPARHGGWAPRVLVGIVVLAIGVFAIAAFDPNQPWTKRQVQALVRSSSGLDVDYGWIRLRVLSGFEVDDLVVHTAPEFRAFAPDLLRAGRIDVGWSTSSLLGHGPRIEQVALSDVALTVVVDEHGRTSFDALGTKPWPYVPLSHRPVQLLASTLPATRIDVTRMDVAVAWTEGGRVVEQDGIRGFGAAVAGEPDRGAWRLRAAAGSADSPLDLHVTRQRDGAPPVAAHVKLSLAVDASTSALSVACDLNVLEQSFVPSIEAGPWHAEASARFEPAAGRTTLALDHVTAARGAGTAEASVEVPDEGDPIVRHAQGDIDVARLLAWIPAGLVPVVAERARLQYRIDSAVLGSPPRFEQGGGVHIDADLSNVKVRTSASVIDVAGGRLVVDGRPAAGEGGALTGRIDARFDRLGQKGSGATIVARDGRCALSLERLHLEGNPPYGGELEASTSSLQVFAGGKRLVDSVPARLTVHFQDVHVDADRPLASDGVVLASIELEGGRASLDAVKRADAIAYTMRASTRSLKAVRPFISQALADAAGWDTMAVALRSSGRVERIASGEPEVQEDTSLDVDRPAFGGVSARSLSLALHSGGTASHHQAVASVRLSALAIEGADTSDDTVALSAAWDRNPRSLRVEAGVEGHANAHVNVSVSFDRKARALLYDVDGRLSDLAPIAPLLSRLRGLDGLDLTRLELGFAARGTLRGVVSNVGPDGAVELEPNPLLTAANQGTADLRVANLRWARGDAALQVPVAVWHGDMRADGARRTLDGHVDLESLRLGLRRHEVEFAGVSDDATFTVTGDLGNPSIDLTQRAAIRSVRQDFVAEYPVGDVTLALSARRDPEGLVSVSSMNLHNGSGGTTLALEGGIDLAGRRRHLSMTADLAQDLEPLSAFPERFAGRGRVEIDATVESSDLALFGTSLHVKVAGVHVRIPGLGVEADSMDGEIPIRLALDVGHEGVAIRRDGRPNPFARLRFTDQHPLLRHSGFLSIGRVTTPFVSIAPFVGNVAVEQNVVSLGQFEMGARGGWITGECALDWDGARSTLEAHLRASGVRSSHGEPFDGNIAVVAAASNRMIEGRAEVQRMGGRHLLDLLDMEDPLHVDPAMNRVRSALDWGYPKRIRVVFENGFASAHLELGGLAQFLSLGDLRGMPTGPIVDRLVEAVQGGRAAP